MPRGFKEHGNELGWASCKRCEDPVLTGVVDTVLPVQLSPYTVPHSHAAILSVYDVWPLVAVEKEVGGKRLWGHLYHPTWTERTKPIAIGHMCYRDRARRDKLNDQFVVEQIARLVTKIATSKHVGSVPLATDGSRELGF